MTNITTTLPYLPFDNIQDSLVYSILHDIPTIPLIKGESLIEIVLERPGNMACLNNFKKEMSEKKKSALSIYFPDPVTLIENYKLSANQSLDKVRLHVQNSINGLNLEKIYLFLDVSQSLKYKKLNSKIPGSWRDLLSRIDKPSSVDELVYGIHIRGNIEEHWNLMLDPNFDIISFDVVKNDMPFALDNACLKEKYSNWRNSGNFSYGVVQARENIGITYQDNLELFRREDMIHASGLETLDPALCYKILNHLNNLKEKIK